jgi:hypothetical protein
MPNIIIFLKGKIINATTTLNHRIIKVVKPSKNKFSKNGNLATTYNI